MAASRSSIFQSEKLKGTVPNALIKYGTVVTRACRAIPKTTASIISLLVKCFMRNSEQSTSRMPMAWKSWDIPRTVNA